MPAAALAAAAKAVPMLMAGQAWEQKRQSVTSTQWHTCSRCNCTHHGSSAQCSTDVSHVLHLVASQFLYTKSEPLSPSSLADRACVQPYLDVFESAHVICEVGHLAAGGHGAAAEQGGVDAGRSVSGARVELVL